MLAIIGGSGLTMLSNLDVSHREVVRTPYGEPSGALVFGQICGQPAMFLPRHGYGHTIPPHMVNYRANLWALHRHQATGIISVASVGGIRTDLQPGEIVIPNQIVDYTSGRKGTFFEGNILRPGERCQRSDRSCKHWPLLDEQHQREDSEQTK